MALEKESKIFRIKTIAHEGLGSGEGSISSLDILTPEQRTAVTELIALNKARIIQPVEEYDDGCGDGRPADVVFQIIDGETGEIHYYNKSKLRAKIFGGGLQVAASMWRAVAGVPSQQESTLGDRTFIAGKLREHGIQYGAHTDNHADGDNCGCGAIDKYPRSVALSSEQEDEMRATAPALVDDVDSAGLDQAFRVRAVLRNNDQYMRDAAGKATMRFIEIDGAVVKRLKGGRREVIVVANDEPGTTVDQRAAAALFRQAGLPEDIDVFVIDVWRGRMYAKVVAEITAVELGVDKKQAEATALADFAVNQLAVAATLTKGDIPVVLNSVA